MTTADSHIKTELPKHWQLKKLGEVCHIIMGQSPPSSSYNTDGIGLPFFQGKAEFTELYPKAVKWCNAPGKIAEANDILLSVRAPVGAVNIASQKCCIGRGLAAIRYENYKYVFYFLRSIEKELDKKGTGTTFRAISGETIRTTEIPLPPLPEQQAIVTKIEELFSHLENGKQQLQTAQQQLKVYRQSLLKAAFEGKLTAHWRQQQTKTDYAIAAEPSATYQRKDVGKNGLPEGWDLKKLGEICITTSGGTPSRGNKKYYEGNIPWVKSGELNKGLIVDTEEKISEEAIKNSSAKIFPKGTLLIALYGATIGKLAFLGVDAATNQAVCGIFKNEKINSDFLFYYLTLRKAFLMKQSIGGAQPNISQGILKNLEIPIPSIKEQHLIVSELESKLSVCDTMEATIKDSLEQAEALRQSVLKKAFEGKLI